MRLIYPHGIGDVIQALPSFEALARQRGETLEIGVLDRLPACREPIERQPYVSRVFGVRDPWRDFEPRDTWEGYHRGMQAILEEHGGSLVWTRPPADPLAPEWCKAYRIARELGVPWEPRRPDVLPMFWLPGFAEGCGVMGDVGPYVCVHGSSGNPAKDLPTTLLGGPNCVVIPQPMKSLAWHLGLIGGADAFVGIDSGPAHLASCLGIEVSWIFKTTPIQQAIPLWRDVHVVVVGPRQDEIVESWDAWRRANASMVRYEVEITKGARDV